MTHHREAQSEVDQCLRVVSNATEARDGTQEKPGAHGRAHACMREAVGFVSARGGGGGWATPRSHSGPNPRSAPSRHTSGPFPAMRQSACCRASPATGVRRASAPSAATRGQPLPHPRRCRPGSSPRVGSPSSCSTLSPNAHARSTCQRGGGPHARPLWYCLLQAKTAHDAPEGCQPAKVVMAQVCALLLSRDGLLELLALLPLLRDDEGRRHREALQCIDQHPPSTSRAPKRVTDHCEKKTRSGRVIT